MFNLIKGQTAIITGATSGIGKSLARDLASLGVHLILTGRRKDKLNELSESLRSNYIVSVSEACFDIRDKQACSEFLETYKDYPVDMLINNAGLAKGADSVQTAKIEDWENMIETNLLGLIRLTRPIAEHMVYRGKGHIINIGSIAGHESYPGGSVYCATKHAVTAFTKSLKMDLSGTGVRVGLVSPGLVNTEFSTVRFDGDREKANNVYSGMTPLNADDISEIIVFILSRPEHVNIMDIIVYPTAQSSSMIVSRTT